MAGDSDKRETLLDWIQGLGLPIASLLASAAFFLLQMQQQSFEAELANVKDGYGFYLAHRTELDKSSDFEKEESLLLMIQTAYPAVFCDARHDLGKRLSIVDTSDAPGAFSSQDRDNLKARLTAKDLLAPGPMRNAPFMGLMTKSDQVGPNKPCNDPMLAPASDIVADASGPAGAAAAAAPAAAKEEVPVPPPAPAAEASDQLATAAPPPPAAAPGGFASKAVRPQLALRRIMLAPSTGFVRVFVHITDSGARTPNIADPFRGPLGALNYRVMRGVERVPSANFPKNAEVRYSGPDQARDANQLAQYLDSYFAGENLHFATKAIGPALPPSNIEVWIPDPR